MDFFTRLTHAIERNQSLLCVGLDPNPEWLPHRNALGVNQRVETNAVPLQHPNNNSSKLLAQLQDWLEFLIAETADRVCAYKPTLGFYTALGPAGLNLLQQVLYLIPADIPVILDAKHGDLNTSTLLAETVFEQWQVDAITLNPYAGQDLAAPFLLYPDKAIFILCHTSNPAAVALQSHPNDEVPLYQQVIQEAQTWGMPEQVCLEAGIANAETLARIRQIASERLILARSIWAAGNDLASILTSGLNASGGGLILPVPQDFLSQKHPSQSIDRLRTEINQLKDNIDRQSSTCNLWLPDVCLLAQQPHADLVLQLYDIGCIIFGDHVQASGTTLPYYIDLRRIISNPQVFHRILRAYADILKTLSFDRIAGIPYGSLPTAAGLALSLHRPMVFPRKEVKAHGTRQLVEGHFQPGETVVVVDDILISGKSAMEGAAKLKSTGLKVNDIVVFIDHEKGVKARLQENGYRGHAVFTISQIIAILSEANRLSDEQVEALTAA